MFFFEIYFIQNPMEIVVVAYILESFVFCEQPQAQIYWGFLETFIFPLDVLNKG